MNQVSVIFGRSVRIIAACWTAAVAPDSLAGSSGLNTVVVVNQSRSNSIDLGNFFCTQRSVPPENVLRILWPGGNISWTAAEFTNSLVKPLTQMLLERRLTNQINYVALSMDLPYEIVWNATNRNSTTSALFYGLKPNDNGAPGNSNSYAFSETAFVGSKSATNVAFLTTMLTAGSLQAAKEMVTHGVRGTGTRPAQPVVLAKSSDQNRNFRSGLFDNAIFNAGILGGMTLTRTNSDVPSDFTSLLGYQTGLAQFTIPTNTFVSGAVGDSTTSFGGRIFGPNDQTSLLEFIHAGAAGSYGTIAEPLADPEKFPNPMVYFYLSRGFTLAESYYQSLVRPYLGTIVGEPLSAPFAIKGHIVWNSSPTNLGGLTQLGISLSAHDPAHPLQQVDLFVDGRFFNTLTNLPPRPGNTLTLKLNGFPLHYRVPTNATLITVASNLTVLINDPAVSNATSVRATWFGDRIELQAANPQMAVSPYYVVDPGVTLTNLPAYRAAYLAPDFPPAIFPLGRDNSGEFRMLLQIATPLHHVVEASTNLQSWLPIFTNTIPGLVEFRDPEAQTLPRRFYRIVGPMPNQRPGISIQSDTPGIRVRLTSHPGQSCAVLASTNTVDWIGLATNQAGGNFEFIDNQVGAGAASRFYRAWLVPPPPPGVSVSTSAPNTALIRVDNAAQPFVVERSTNGLTWVALATNFAFHDIQVEASSAVGTADLNTTWLRAARPTMQASTAYGLQNYTFLAASLTAGAWVQFDFRTTNGTTVLVGATNNTAGISVTNLALELFQRINAEVALQGSGGVVAEDFHVNAGEQAKFNLRARSPGESAAQLGVQANVSGFATGVSVSPATYRKLTKNLEDLRSRNHLYVAAGVANLDLNFPLNTATLPDGFHELCAVAYEGTSVRSQSQKTMGVEIHNTALAADLVLTGTNVLSVTNSFILTVTANTNSVREILLYTTGGLFAGITNQPVANFPVAGTALGAGEHPFYALITTTNGLQYRTELRRVTLTRP